MLCGRLKNASSAICMIHQSFEFSLWRRYRISKTEASGGTVIRNADIVRLLMDLNWRSVSILTAYSPMQQNVPSCSTSSRPTQSWILLFRLLHSDNQSVPNQPRSLPIVIRPATATTIYQREVRARRKHLNASMASPRSRRRRRSDKVQSFGANNPAITKRHCLLAMN